MAESKEAIARIVGRVKLGSQGLEVFKQGLRGKVKYLELHRPYKEHMQCIPLLQSNSNSLYGLVIWKRTSYPLASKVCMDHQEHKTDQTLWFVHNGPIPC
jgi:hypothetical protein